jgi:DNA-directed RNA polymerase specialized sigma24 family protein
VGVETVKSRLRYAMAKLRAELADLDDGLREGRR